MVAEADKTKGIETTIKNGKTITFEIDHIIYQLRRRPSKLLSKMTRTSHTERDERDERHVPLGLLPVRYIKTSYNC
jgi:hypothetical protein